MLERHLNTRPVWSNFVFSYSCVSVVPIQCPELKLLLRFGTSAVSYHASLTLIRYWEDFFHRSVVKRRGLPMNRSRERKNENYMFRLIYCCWWRSPTLQDCGNMFQRWKGLGSSQVFYLLQKHLLLVRNKWNTMSLSIFSF